MFPLVHKRDLYKVFEELYRWAERQLGRKLRAIQTDNALEFRKLGRRMSEPGIDHQMSTPYSHQQMGHVERRHRHLIDTTIFLINHANFPPSLWDFSVLIVCYLYNRNLTPLLHGRSSLKVLFNRTPEYAKLWVFGYKCFPCLRPYRANNLDIKLVPCIFVDYSVQQDAYLCLDPATRQIFTSRDIVFDELDFSLNKSLWESTSCKDPWNLDNTSKVVSLETSFDPDPNSGSDIGLPSDTQI